MCTVSFVRHSEGFSLTSNRDEVSSRPTSPPRVYHENDQKLVYPKDELAGGTWIATSAKDVSVCLLNGAFEKHKRQLPYKKSRGVVLKERFEFETHLDFINKVDLVNVEPFTLLMIDHKNISNIDFKALVWDENEKHIFDIDPRKPHIWASSTLYDEEQRKLRKRWFNDFLKNNRKPNRSSLMDFHTGSYTDNKREDIVMQRKNNFKTMSVSQIHISADQKCFLYHDLEENETYNLNLDNLCHSV